MERVLAPRVKQGIFRVVRILNYLESLSVRSDNAIGASYQEQWEKVIEPRRGGPDARKRKRRFGIEKGEQPVVAHRRLVHQVGTECIGMGNGQVAKIGRVYLGKTGNRA